MAYLFDVTVNPCKWIAETLMLIGCNHTYLCIGFYNLYYKYEGVPVVNIHEVAARKKKCCFRLFMQVDELNEKLSRALHPSDWKLFSSHRSTILRCQFDGI